LARRLPGRLRAIALAVGLAPALLCLQACKSSAERADALAQQAQAQASAGDLAAARQSIDAAIALRDDQAAYHTLRGAIAIRDNDTLAAYQSFSRALEFDATNKLALSYVASIGIQVGQMQEGEDAADRLLAIEPNALAALQVKGMTALWRDRYDEAMQYADRILASRPGDEAAAIIKARALVKFDKTEEAIALIDNALQTSPNSVGLLMNKLNFYRFLKRPEQMASVMEQVVRLSSNTPALRLDQANLLYRLGRMDEARQAGLNLLVMGSRKPEDYRTLQRLWWQYDDKPLSEAAARTSAKWEDPRAIASTARYLMLRGDLRTADILLRSAPERFEQNFAALRVRLLAAAGHTAEARKQTEALLKRDDQDVDALLLRAQFALQDGDARKALEAAQLALTNDPLNPEAYVALVNVYRARGADERARQIFEDGMRSQPQSFYLVEQYLRYLRARGDKSRAISLTQTFARNVPSLPRPWELLGAQCQWAGDQNCLRKAAEGYNAAKNTYLVDDPPGTTPDRGLLGRL